MKAIRADGKETIELLPGEWKPDGYGAVIFNTPNGHLGQTRDGVWKHEWHEDGSVTITPSLRVSGGREGKKTLWHGYLTKGEWKDCGDY